MRQRMPTPSVSEAANTRFRHRKISVKQRLHVYKASDLKSLDKDELQQRELVEIETGVEKNEEKEEHLHKILQKNQLTSKDLYIPTPDASRTWPEYEKFYTGKFIEPGNYIRFSATVEDCCGPCYTMDERDEEYLKETVNSKLEEDDRVTEDEFEIICSNFETAIKERQPFLSMDPHNILSFEELKPTILKRSLGDAGIKSKLAEELGLHSKPFMTQLDPPITVEPRPISVLLERFGSQIYGYWKERKIEAHGDEIFPQLKFERPGEKDDNDPYICFRRREVRHARKTRRVDFQNSNKLRLLYQQLQYTKELAFLVAKREKMSMDMLEKDRQIFELRRDIKPLKRSLGIRGEDEDLVSHKKRRLTSNVIMTNASEINARKLKSKSKKAASATPNAKPGLSKGSNKLTKQQAQQMQQLQQLQQQKQQANAIAAHVYVKLPSSKVPDIILEDVENILSTKEKSARRYVEERMRKRRLEDGELFFNLTDDPYNPVFDISIPKNVSSSNAPFSSIASSKFETDRSYYVPHLENYLSGNTDEIRIINKDGESVENPKYKKVELFNPFDEHREVYTRDLPLKLRRRVGRLGIEYVDRRRSENDSNSLAEFLDFSEIERQERENDVIDVYDSKLDELYRLHDKWKYNSETHEYGTKFSNEPARLNQISNETQVIRFGTMLGTKSYEQLRDATLKYRQEIYNQRKIPKTINSSRQQRSNGSNGSSTSGTATPLRPPSASSLKKTSNTKQQQVTPVK